jgi:putative ABC transport system substrate-binding protein
MAVKILNGNEPSQLPYEYPQKIIIYINERIVDSIGLKIPEKIRKNATIISK